jgi:hypothetical protein
MNIGARAFTPDVMQSDQRPPRVRRKESASHQRERRMRASARVMLTLAKSKQLLARHHTWDAQQDLELVATGDQFCDYDRNTMKSVHAHVSYLSEAMAPVGPAMQHFDERLSLVVQAIVLLNEKLEGIKSAIVYKLDAQSAMFETVVSESRKPRTCTTNTRIASAFWEPLVTTSCHVSNNVASSSWEPIHVRLPIQVPVEVPKGASSSMRPRLDPEAMASMQAYFEKTQPAREAIEKQIAQDVNITARERSRSPTQHVKPADLLAPGTLVMITGLVNVPDLNGASGSVLRYLHDKDRYAVAIDSGGSVLLRPKHLKVLQVSDDDGA